MFTKKVYFARKDDLVKEMYPLTKKEVSDNNGKERNKKNSYKKK